MSATVGIIGSGVVGQALAKGFAKHGYEVKIGTNTAAKREELNKKLAGMATVGTFEEAATFGRLLVLAVKGTAAEAALNAAGLSNVAGKTVIDTTNPIADAPPVNGVIQYFTGPNESLLERIQRLAPQAHFVKAFSTIGNSLMVNPNLGPKKPTMFYCGNSESAKTEVKGVLEKFGFEPEDMGKAEGARAIEPLCMLWCIPGFLRNEWTHAVVLQRK